MSDRRRNLFILLAVVGLMAASAVVVATKPTRLGLDLQGGVQLVYEGRPTKQQPVVNAEGDLPADAVADVFPAYDDDGGLLLVLTPQ